MDQEIKIFEKQGDIETFKESFMVTEVDFPKSFHPKTFDELQEYIKNLLDDEMNNYHMSIAIEEKIFILKKQFIKSIISEESGEEILDLTNAFKKRLIEYLGSKIELNSNKITEINNLMRFIHKYSSSDNYSFILS